MPVPLLQRMQEALRKAEGIRLQHLLPTPGLPSASPGDNFGFLQAAVQAPPTTRCPCSVHQPRMLSTIFLVNI